MRRPLFACTEVEDAAEDDVGHRRALGHGERDGEERNASLRVHASVDRVEDEPRRLRAERPLAQLLGDERELDAGRGKLLQARDDGELGSGVDGGRLVSSFARADHGLPLEPRGVLREDDVQVGGDLPGEGQPVGHSSKGERTRPLVNFGKK